MNLDEIKAVQAKVGADVDGIWGPASTRATEEHLRALMPSPHPFPTPQEIRSGNSMFGEHGDPDGDSPPMVAAKLPFTAYLYGRRDSPVHSISCHKLAAKSLGLVFEDLAETFPTEEARDAAGILDYYGCYNPRRIRQGSVWSMHSWAIAVDFNAPANMLNDHWPRVAEMPLEVMECFSRQGWIAAGAWWSADAMHFEASQPY